MSFIDSGTANLAQLKVGNSKFSRIKTLGQQVQYDLEIWK